MLIRYDVLDEGLVHECDVEGAEVEAELAKAGKSFHKAVQPCIRLPAPLWPVLGVGEDEAFRGSVHPLGGPRKLHR